MDLRPKTNRRNHGSNEGNLVTNPCRFFKLMVSPTIQFKKLRLPHAFASKFRDEISEACHLTVPTGETHQVALVQEDNNLWFQDGWQEFVDRFSISYGYFIIFTYNGNSNFRVNLFDRTACEISYPCLVQNEPNVGGFSEKLDGDDRENIVLENSYLPSASHQKSDVEVIELDIEDDEMKSEELSETIAGVGEETEGSQMGSDLPVWLSNYAEELDDMAAAGIPMPTNPFFVALMKPYVLHNGGFLNIPRPFARNHMMWKAGNSIKIEMCDGNQWLVQCNRSHSNSSLGKGWLQFAREACLEVGDVCLFELIDAKKFVLKAHVVKSSYIKAARVMVEAERD